MLFKIPNRFYNKGLKIKNDTLSRRSLFSVPSSDDNVSVKSVTTKKLKEKDPLDIYDFHSTETEG